MKRYHETEWTFLNMNSPADLSAEYQTEAIRLQEYDRCRDGHALISRFYVDKDDVFFQTTITQTGAGAGIGLYFGDGCFSKYCLVVLDEMGVSVRMPNGVSQGDTFRQNGPKRYYTAVHQTVPFRRRAVLGLRMQNQQISVFVDGKTVINSYDLPLLFAVNDLPARIMVKAMNENDSGPAADTWFSDYQLEGVLESVALQGICRSSGKNNENVFLHIAEDFSKWAKTDRDGAFSIPALPFGRYTLVGGIEGKDFSHISILHDGSPQEIDLEFSGSGEREGVPQENLKTSLPWQTLNGIWKFEFDKGDIGEEEGWFLPENHTFSKCIRVPGSWQSLMAYGEEFMADAYSLHQANSFACAYQELGETGWYQRTFRVNWENTAAMTELVFAAVSGVSAVWLDDRKLGYIVDSYQQQIFSLGHLDANRDYTLTVRVNYEHGNNWACSGKQGFWFTDSPGIWQNVWLRESRQMMVSDILVESQKQDIESYQLTMRTIFRQNDAGFLFQLTPDRGRIHLTVAAAGWYRIRLAYQTEVECRSVLWLDGAVTDRIILFEGVPRGDCYDTTEFYLCLKAGIHELLINELPDHLTLLSACIFGADLSLKAGLYLDDQKLTDLHPEISGASGMPEAVVQYTLKNPKLWSPDVPWRYRLSVRIEEQGEVEYFRHLGLRDITVLPGKAEHCQYIAVNGKKTYIRGILDQGYNPWGLYTYRSIHGDAPGSIAFDIRAARDCGYNLIRMHIKDNEPEWYETCDRTGMLVWDEHPSNFYGTAENIHWQSMYQRQLRRMARKHNYHPSVIIASVLNESWGISGDHEKSPWDDPAAQALIQKYARDYKAYKNHVLTVDNSGYGKTSETDLIDHHSYPDGFYDARDFFARLAKQNYPGSCFNFYHSANQIQMQQDEIRDLLQRTCRQDLKKMAFTGNEVQKGQPVIISEFVHTDKQEELVRIYPEFAGYVRMNIASQENEDTSPLTATRKWRSTGFVDENLDDMTDQRIAHEDLLYLDYPFLTKSQPGEMLNIPVYLSLWSDQVQEAETISVEWKLMGIDDCGEAVVTDYSGILAGIAVKELPYRFGEICCLAPEGLKGGYLYVMLRCHGQVIARSYLQLEIFSKNERDCFENRIEFLPEQIKAKKGFSYTGIYQTTERNLIWGYGIGELCYDRPVTNLNWDQAELILEVSVCNIPEGTRETDTADQPGSIAIYLQELLVWEGVLDGQPFDRKALFSNSSAGPGVISKYSETGVYGYGYRLTIGLPLDVIRKIKEDHAVSMKIKAKDRGIVIYGNRMGRYGCHPMIKFGPGKEMQHDK